MKNIFISLILTLFLLSCTAAEPSTGKSTNLKAQTHCPIRGGEIDKEVYTDYQGQRIYYCCPGCDKKFLANPGKYLAEMKAAGVQATKLQTSCPVSDESVTTGDVIVKSFAGDVALCCKKCSKKFKAKPTPYILKLKKQGVTIGAIARENEQKTSEDHSGHNHHDH